MIDTFRNRNFSLLWFAGLISLMGNWMLIVAIPFHIFAVTDSALATSAWLMAYILPGVLFGSVAGVFVDRWDRRKTMIAVNLLQMLTIPLLLLVQSPEWIWIVYVVGFLESTLSQFFGPAESALLPTLVGEENLTAANSLNSLNDNLARIIGSAIGGVLLGMWGLSSVVLADALSYFVAAVLIALISVPAITKAAQSETATSTGRVLSSSKGSAQVVSARAKFVSVWQEWIAGLKLVAKDPLLSRIFIVVGIALFADAILSAILVVFVQGDAGLGAAEFGWMLTARGIGGLVGGLLIAQFGSKFSNRQLASWGLIISGVLIIVAVLQPTLIVLLVTMALVGIPAIAWIVAIQTMLQQAAADEYRGRVFGAYGTTISLLMLVSSGLAGASADWIGATALILISAVIYIVSGLMGWVMLRQPKEEKVVTTAV